jgi:HlyD family secretion protein
MDNDEKENIIAKAFNNKKIRLAIVGILALILIWRVVIAPTRGDFETTEVKKGTVAEELILSGEIKAKEHAKLKFQGSGEIGWLGVSEGQWVKKGELLIRLDTANLYAAYEQAVATLRSAQATADRALDDVKDRGDEETFTEAETRTIAEAARDKAYRAKTIAQENLANGGIRAPFDGIISSITNPFSGVNIIYSENQIEIVNPETLYVEVSVDQSEVIELTEGQKATIVLDSFIDEEIQGEIDFISYTPMAGEIGSVYKITVKPTSDVDPGKVRIGMTGDAKFILSEKEDVLYVPNQFVNTDIKGKYVFKNTNDNKVYVEIGMEGEERIEIIGDIKEGDILYD